MPPRAAPRRQGGLQGVLVAVTDNLVRAVDPETHRFAPLPQMEGIFKGAIFSQLRMSPRVSIGSL
jgi:hypothetical protein